MDSEYDVKIAIKLVSISQKCNDNKIPFRLSFSRLKQLYNTKKCYFTGKVLTENSRSIDRLDPAVGYTDSNVVACDKTLNGKKTNLTPLEIKQLYNGLKRKKVL